MLKVDLDFNLVNFPLEEQVRMFWTKKGNAGYEFFKEKAKLVMLSISVGQMFDFEAYINGGYGRDIIVDFKTTTFLIEEKRGIIDPQGEAKVFVRIKPIINRIEFL